MSDSASSRYGVRPTPGGLALVQDLLNTSATAKHRQPDLLDELATARAWFGTAVELWSELNGVPTPKMSMTGSDLRRLWEIRVCLRSVLSRRGDLAGRCAEPPLRGSVGLSLDGVGGLTVRPEGKGAEWLAAAVLVEIQTAHQTDTWRRLKLCRNDQCAVAFYDRSRNNSGVWHDVHVCGNAANLRASRARRKADEALSG